MPVFNQYSTMWERTLGVAHRAVGLEEVHNELAVVDAFVEYLCNLLEDKIAEEMRRFSNRFDLGMRKDNGRLGILFSERLVDFGIPKDQPNDGGKTLHMTAVIDGAAQGDFGTNAAAEDRGAEPKRGGGEEPLADQNT
ncbi:hypothetical protein [Paraburkholderia sp. BL6665CI2N2]|uniref:hypothetical protein n=1 Tax=Paraburkholderia sp. BL6665CI2N2 TaxID=1938806 RepID=UPI00106586A4|nr:hypothetical protein [Paraburkholderia sp. BL6665CI2N2]